jgi:hypothetical protein
VNDYHATGGTRRAAIKAELVSQVPEQIRHIVIKLSISDLLELVRFFREAR